VTANPLLNPTEYSGIASHARCAGGFSDPDEGLELRDDFKMEIQDSLATVAAGRG